MDDKTNQHARQRCRYLVVAGANALIDFGTINFLVTRLHLHSGAGLLICNGAAFFLSTLNSYLLNRHWTFGERGRPRLRQCLLFFFLALSGLGINTGVVHMVNLMRPAQVTSAVLWINVAKVVASVASMVWNYHLYRYLVFHRRRRYFPEMLPRCANGSSLKADEAKVN